MNEWAFNDRVNFDNGFSFRMQLKYTPNEKNNTDNVELKPTSF